MQDYSNKRFLVVDDFSDFRTSMKSMLRDIGAKDVDTADRGEDALALCRHKRYDIILHDYNLGAGKNGQQVLEELKGSSADVEASALISTDGLMIASALPAGMDEDRVGAMSAALLSLGDRAARELARGTLERVLLQGERGYVIMSSSGTEAVLTVLAKQNAKLGLLFLDIKRAAEALSKLI